MTSSSGGAAPADATYVVLSVNATLTDERVLTGTANQITITDNGAGSTVVLSLPQSIATSSTPTFASLTLTGASSLTLGTASSAAGAILLKNASNANTATIVSGVTAASYSVTWPTAQGGASTFLQNNGSGVLSWAAGGAGTVTDVSVVTANGVSGSVATSTTTPAITLTLGAITPTTVNGNTITTGTGTLTLGAGKTLTASNTLTFTGTDGSSVAFGTGGTVLYTASAIPLTVGTTTIASGTDTRILYDNAGVLGEYTLTGTGTVVAMATSPVLTTPNIGVATATSVNGLTITSSTGTLTITNAKTLSATNTLTLSGTDGTTMTFPTTTATIARTDAGQTFTGVNTFTSPSITTSLTTGSSSFDLLNATATTINFAGASGSVVNLGGGANAAELRFLEPSGSGTNYSALKAQAQGANITYTLPATVGSAGQVLTDAAGNGTLSWTTPSSGGSATTVVFSTIFETIGRLTDSTGDGGTVTVNDDGATITSGITTNGRAGLSPQVYHNGNALMFANNPKFNCNINCNTLGAVDNPQAFVGFGNVSNAAGSITRTGAHIGFFIKRESGVWNLYGSSSDASTASLTAVLTTLADNDTLDLAIAFTTGSSISFYYAKNGGAMSSATTKSTNLPASSNTDGQSLQFFVNNGGTTSSIELLLMCASFSRH